MVSCHDEGDDDVGSAKKKVISLDKIQGRHNVTS